nr:zinc finger, CCHC-type [Tanacetum cinerariifolium]
HLHIEESLRAQDNDKLKANNVACPSIVNMVEHNNSSRYNDNKGKRKHQNTKTDPNKKPKVTCWKCGKPVHLKKDCKAGNVGKKANVSGTKGLGDSSSNSPKGNKKYFVTFIGDASKFCYVYLLHSKDEALDKFKAFKTKVELQQASLIIRFRTDRGFVRFPDPKLKTLDERGIECIFFGYAEHSKSLRFYAIEHNDSVAINLIIESKDAIFDEHMFSSVPRPSQRSMAKRTKDSGGLVVPENVTEEIDVKTAFLNGELDEEAPKQWHQKFDEVVLSNGYLLNQANKYVYRKFDESGKGVIISLYVDDMLIFGTDQVQVDITKEFFSSRFSMKDMREADVILVQGNNERNFVERFTPKVMRKVTFNDQEE